MRWLLQGPTLHNRSEGVAIEHVAVFLACIVPGALIALNQESLQLLSPIQALRIYCAGIWHNVMFCAGCYLSLMLLPMVLYPFYVWNQYPVISNIDAKSPLARHLNHGDSILKVAGHQLQSPEDWFEFLHNRSIQEELAQLNHTSIAHVIVEESQKASYHVALQGFCVCSENFTKHQNRLLGSVCPDDALLFYQHSCASAMPSSVKTSQNIYCSKATDVVKCPACRLEKNSEVTPCSGCSESTLCLFPLLSHGEVFVEIEVQKLRCSVNPADPYCEHNLVFVGNLRDLFHSLLLTKYWPRQGGLFGLFSVSFSVSIPKFFERLLMYTFSISAAMALMNSAPVFYLDGELVLEAWFQNSKSWVHPKKHKRIMQIVLTGGSALVAFFFIFEFIRTCS